MIGWRPLCNLEGLHHPHVSVLMLKWLKTTAPTSGESIHNPLGFCLPCSEQAHLHAQAECPAAEVCFSTSQSNVTQTNHLHMWWNLGRTSGPCATITSPSCSTATGSFCCSSPSGGGLRGQRLRSEVALGEGRSKGWDQRRLGLR